MVYRPFGGHRFIEVYVQADIRVCMERDPKNLYKKNIDKFTGISSVYEAPKNPDLKLNTELLTVEESYRHSNSVYMLQ